MAGRFEDQMHLIRMAGVFVVGGLVFLLMRGLLVPSDFGELGHYRASALEDNRAITPSAYRATHSRRRLASGSPRRLLPARIEVKGG